MQQASAWPLGCGFMTAESSTGLMVSFGTLLTGSRTMYLPLPIGFAPALPGTLFAALSAKQAKLSRVVHRALLTSSTALANGSLEVDTATLKSLETPM